MIMVTPLLWLVLAAEATSAAVAEVASPHHSYLAYVFPGPGQFLTSLAIGTPPVTFTAILDTGSDLVWRQCLPCKLCYPQSPPTSLASFCNSINTTIPKRPCRHHRRRNCSPASPTNTSLSAFTGIFNPSLSSSYSTAPCSAPACLAYSGSCSLHHTCTYNTVYIAPTAYTRGILSYDTLTIPSMLGPPAHIRQFAFGCSHSSKAPYNFAGASGIVGFGRGPLSLPSQLNVSRFSYCLGSIDNTISLSPLVLGPAASLGASKGTQFNMDILNMDDGYVVELIGISIAGEPLNISSSSLGLKLRDFGVSTAAGGAGIIFDSGTTFTHLPPKAFQAFIEAFRVHVDLPRSAARPRNLTTCYQSPGLVPSLSFHFNGATMHLPPRNYFISIEGVFCLAFLESGGDLAIFGNVQQQNYHILYDLEANVISFKPTQCHALFVNTPFP